MRHQSFTLVCTPDTFRPRDAPAGGLTGGLTIVPAAPDEVARCRGLWAAVGSGFWTERLDWDDARWRAHLARPEVSFWVARLGGQEGCGGGSAAPDAAAPGDIGCFELLRADAHMAVEGFGLLPAFRGRGLGRALLTAATQQAFGHGAARVRLETATDDHPHALPNYLAGGYRVVAVRELDNPMPPRTPPAAPG